MSWPKMLSHGGSEILLFYVDDQGCATAALLEPAAFGLRGNPCDGFRRPAMADLSSCTPQRSGKQVSSLVHQTTSVGRPVG
jgi:hypothetical protein